MIGSIPKFGHISEYMRDTVLHWLPVRQLILYRLFTIVWRCVLGIAPTYLLELFTLTSACSGRHLSALPPEVILSSPTFARLFHSIGPSRSWVPPPGMVSHMNPALFHGICPAPFTTSLKLLFSLGPGLRAPLSSYLEVALYKFHK